jgi:hypothetical protein
VRRLGPAAVLADLSHSADPTARILRRAVGQCAHLLAPLEPAPRPPRRAGQPPRRSRRRRGGAAGRAEQPVARLLQLLPRERGELVQLGGEGRAEAGDGLGGQQRAPRAGRRSCPSRRSRRARRRFPQPGHALLRCPGRARAAEQVGCGRAGRTAGAGRPSTGQACAHPVLHTSSPRLAGCGGTAGGERRRRFSMPSDPVRAVRQSGHYREVASAQWP